MKHGQTLKTHKQEQRQGHSQDQGNTSKCKLQALRGELPPLTSPIDGTDGGRHK